MILYKIHCLYIYARNSNIERETLYVNYIAEFLYKRQYDFNERIPNVFEIWASLYLLNNVLNTDE